MPDFSRIARAMQGLPDEHEVPEEGFYYLHTNGELIYKRFMPESDSDFVRAIWRVIPSERESAWSICIEALAMGARKDRVMELATKWGLTDEDAQEFAKRLNLRLMKDGDSWMASFDDFVDVATSQVGFGNTCLEALAALAKPGLEKVHKRILPY